MIRSDMNLLVLVVFLLQLMSFHIYKIEAKIEPHIWCGACIAMIEDMKIQIGSVDKKKKLQVGSFRLDADGSRKLKEIPYSTSDLFLMDEFERICYAMHHYGETTGSNGEKIIIRTSSYDGTSVSMKKVRKDSDLTRVLTYACETLIEEHEDDMLKILKTYHDERSEVEKEICVTKTGICTDDDVKTRMWTMAQAVMAGIQEKADERLNQSLQDNPEDVEGEGEEEEEQQAEIDGNIEPEVIQNQEYSKSASKEEL